MTKYDWQEISDDLQSGQFASVSEAADFLGIPYGTVYDAFKRGDLPGNVLEAEGPDPLAENITFTERGNEATLKYKAGEPLSPAEALEVAGIDKKEWRIVDQSVNMWQMGRKAKEVNMSWIEGSATGFVRDSGEINKAYLYQVTVKLTRINRVAVKPVIKPINFTVPELPAGQTYSGSSENKILFVCDPHFGFRREITGKLVPFHKRNFIGSLMKIARTILPDVVVWNGDVLDLADFSSFDTDPAILYSTQLAGIELAWVMGQFGRMTPTQIAIEGNHDQRLQRALVKNMKSAYQLRPVHDLESEPLMSVPRFLGLDSLRVKWIDGYPTANVRIGDAKFLHGKTVRKGSAKTVAAEITEATGSRFFGHIHRHELAQKYVEDSEQTIWVGSPGCACDKTVTPGANQNHNWQLGAFLIHQTNGQTVNVEHINGLENGDASFRGLTVAGDYYEDFVASLPDEYQSQY